METSMNGEAPGSGEALDLLNNLRSKMNDRSAIQKKTFTKWINTYLIKVGQAVDDLYEDLSDGNKLITLLEILTGERLPRERGKMRFHNLQNVENSLNLLKRKKIRLVNIRNDDIVDGNPKLILGLIWTIILNFEISHDPEGQASAKATLIDWAKRATRGYKGVDVRNFTSSFKNGMAFNAIIHRFRPDIIDYDGLKPENAEKNLENAFSVAEEELGIPRLLDVEDFILDELDEKSIMTYLSAFNRMYSKVPSEEELAVKVYSDRINVDAKKILNWLKANIDRLEKKIYKMDPEMFEKYKADLKRIEDDEMPEKRELKDYLGDCYKNLKLAEAEDMITTDITHDKIENYWDMLEKSLADKKAAVQGEKDRINAQNELADRIQQKAEQAAAKLDQIKQMILHPPEEVCLSDLIQEAKQLLYNSNMEEDARAMYSGVSALMKENHPRADELSAEVQLVSDELDEIKVRLDTLHEDLEQGAIDQIDSRINDLMTQIQAKNDQLKEDGCGDNIQGALRILDNLLTLMDEVDALQQDITAVKAAVAENPRADVRQEAKLQDLDYEYSQLKSNCVTKDQDMREGVEFLEAIAELLKWGREQKDSEMKFDWSEYHPLEHPYEKSLVQGISKQQKKFDQLLNLGKQLLKTEHPMSRVIGEEVEELCELWTCLKDLACVAEKHIQHNNDYELFWKRLNNANMWITQKRNLLDTRYNAKCLDVVASSERLQELVDMKKDIIGYDPNIVEIANLGKIVVNLSKRKMPKSGERVLALCPFKRAGPNGNVDHRHDIISRGEECLYISSTAVDLWRIKKGLSPPPKVNGHHGNTPNSNGPGNFSSGLVTEVPSCIFTTLPPDEECLNESEKTGSDYQALKVAYDRQRGYLKHVMVKHEFFSNCDVVLTWPYDKNFEAELRGRELVITNLKEAGEGLIVEADNHPNSDKTDILDRQNAALDHWDFLLKMHKNKTSALSDLEAKVEGFDKDVDDVVARFAVVVITPDNIGPAEKSLDKILKDIVAMVDYGDELDERIHKESDDTCAEDFQPLINKLYRVQVKLSKFHPTCEAKARCVGRLMALQDLLQNVMVTLENVSDTLADMHLYPLEVERVAEDIKKLQLISEDLVGEDESIIEIESIREELEVILKDSPLLVEIGHLLDKRDTIFIEIDQRSQILSGDSEPGIAHYDVSIARALHWLEDAEGKLRKEQLQSSFKLRYQLLTVLRSDVTLKVCLFEDLKEAQEQVISSSDAYEVLLENYRNKFPITSPSKGLGDTTARSLAKKEGDAVHEQYFRIKEDVNRLVLVNEERYKSYERLQEELDLFLGWCHDTKNKLDNPPQVLIQLKEVSRLKAQRQEMVDDVTAKGNELQELRDGVSDYVTKSSETKTEETEGVKEKLKLVQEEYTIILRAAKNASQDLQETMDRVEKVVYWYNCLQQYLKNSRKRLEILDPVATDVVEVAKQLKHCKAITTELESKEELIEEMMKESEYLLSLADNDHLYVIPADLGDKVTSFRSDWKKFCAKCRSQEKRLERTYTKIRKLEAALDKILRWQNEKEKELAAAPPISSEPHIIKEQLEQIKSLRAIVDGCESHITTANELARSLINKAKMGADSMPPLKQKLEKINEGWKRMNDTITQRLYDLESALKKCQGIEKALEDIKRWLDEKEAQLNVKDPLAITDEGLQEQLSKYTELKRDIHGYEGVITSITEKALEGLSLDDADKMKDKLASLQDRYNSIRSDCDDHQDKLSEVYKAMDNLKRDRETIDGMIKRSKEQAGEMSPIASSIPILNSQLKEVVQHLSSIDAIKPEIASFAQECDDACDLMLLQAAPKLQREILKYPKAVEESVQDLEKTAIDRKKDIENKIQELKEIDDKLDNFISELARNKKDFDRQSSEPNLHPKTKKQLVDDFQKVHRALEKTLNKIDNKIDDFLSDLEETPFLKRRLQEARQKLDDFALSLNSGRDSADKVESILKKNEKERLSMMEQVLLLDEDLEALEPISINVAAATAQSLQNMTLSERCETLRRSLSDLKLDLDDVASDIPAATKKEIEEEQNKLSEKMDKISDKLKNRGDALDGVLPFITSLQDIEADVLPWLDDMSMSIASESAKPDTTEEIKAKIAAVKELLKDIEAHKIDLDDVATFGESALELVTSYDPDKMCQSAVDLGVHLEDVQKRYNDLKLQLDDLECELTNQEGIAQKLAEIAKSFDKVQEYTDNMPKPRLQEAELVQFMADIDEELGDVFILEEKMRVLENEYPNSASDPAVRAQLEKIKETKKTLEDKKDDLRDKSDMLDALSEDMADINNAIKSISPQKNTVPLTDLKSVEDNERYQEDLEPKISSLEDKLEKLEEVHARISKDCNPADVKKLQAKIDDLKKKCKDKEEKKNEKIEELKKTKDHLHKFDDASQKLSTWLENQINELKNQEPPSTSSNILKEQLDQHNQFTDDVQDEGKDLFKDLLKIGQVLKNDLLQNDKPLNDKIAELQKKYDNLLKDATKRQEELEAAMMDAKNIRETLDYIMPELLEKETELLKAEKPGADLETVQSQVEHHKADAQQLQSHAQLIASLRDQEGLGEEDQDLLDEIMNKWDRCNELSDERKEALSGAFDQILDFEKALADVGNFMDAVEAQLIENDGVPLSNIDIVDDMMGKQKEIQDAMLTKSADVEFVNNLGDNYKNVTDPEQAAIIADKLEELNKKWDWLLGEVAEREAGLQKARDTTAAIDMRLNDLMAWLEDQEEYLKGCGPVADTYDGLVEQLGEHKNVHAGFDEHQDDYDSIVITCQELLTESEDPTVGESLDEKLQDLGQKWDSVVKASMARQRAIEEAMQICHDFQDSVNAILEWLPDAENALDSLEPISDDYETISEQIQELLQLSYFMADQNTAVEQVCTLGAIREETGPALSDDENARYKEMKDRYKELWNKIGARQDELNARQEALEAEDDLASFDITEWKKRFLRWMDGNHERIIDLFRKFDVNKDGTLSHQEFKDGIIQAGIPTPRSCFPTIIREFDRDDSGDINYREFAAALKRYEFKPKTEGEHIDYEVQRAVDRCSCRRRFNCVQVGEAKYSPGSDSSKRFNGVLWRFGNMQKLYLVRILSTVVMVRVGGGWQPLHEFLQKYDPCRAKGRTNVDLGKVKLKKDGEGRVISPLKFLTKFKPGSGPGTPRAQTPDGRARKPSAETSRGRITMSAGVRQSASREFEGLEIEHDAKQISFPGYKVKGGYVSPYSCQALGLKKRSGSQGSLCSSGSTEFDSPVRRSPSKNLNKSGSRSSVLSKSSSRGSISSRGSASVKGPGTFAPGIAARGLSASTPRSNSRSDLTKPGTARGTPSPVTRPRHMSPRSQSTVGMSPRTPTPRTPTPNRASPITRTQSEARMKPKTAPPAGTSTPVRQRTGAVSKSDSTGRTPISRRNTAANLSSSTPTTSTTRPKQTKPKKPAETKQ